MMFLGLLSALLPGSLAFDVVGWYVGDNLTNWPMDIGRGGGAAVLL